MASIVDYILIQKATLQGIANAIRTKKGTTGVIKVVDMAKEISTIQGTSTTKGSCIILVGGKFSYNYGNNKDLKIYCPSCVTYEDNGSELIFTAVSAGSGTVTVMSGSTALFIYSVTATGGASTCNHTTFTTEITTPALCSQVGIMTHTCTACQTTWTEEIPTLGHTWSDPYVSDAFSSGYGRSCEECGELEELSCPHENTTETVTKYATCYHTGTKSVVCDDCGAVVRTETIPKSAHSWSEVVAGDQFSQGWGRYCLVSACGATEEDVECPHTSSTATVTKNATCTATGTRTYTCDVCKTTTGTETIPKLDHTWSDSYASDEFANGYGRKCTVCGALDNSQSCPHTKSTPQVTKAATCYSTGIRTYYCDACGTVTGTETISRVAHNYVPVVTAPTCTTEGYTTHTCSVCRQSYIDTATSALGHAWSGWTTTVKPTCDDDGTETRTCSRCNKVETSPVEALGHNTTYYAGKAATCTSDGYTGYNVCSVCGDIVDGKLPIPATGHTEVVDAGKSATCTATGLTEGKHCSVCGTVLVAQEITSALGHSYEAVVTAPTCTEYGYTTHTCTRCGHSYTDNQTEPNGHNFVSGWIVTTDPTCTTTGVETRTCLSCGHKETRSVAASGHAWGDPYYSSEFSTGYGHKCQRSGCGETEELAYVECEHPESAYSESVITEPTCTETGSKTCSCDVCNQSWSEEIAALGHSWKYDSELSREPECEFGGVDVNKCTRCGITEETELDPLGHSWVLIKDDSQSLGASLVCEHCGCDGGEAEYDCSVLGHDTSDGVYDIDGVAMYKCKHCNEYYPAD